MAKIIRSKLDTILDEIVVGDKKDDLSVKCELWFHPMDLTLKMEYMLQVFIYDTRGAIDTPVILPNWDQSKIEMIDTGRRDDYLGTSQQLIKATQEHITVSLSVALQLGVLNKINTYHTRHLRAFVSLLPCIGRSVLWTEELEVEVLH